MVRASDQQVKAPSEGFLIGSLLAALRQHITDRVLHALHGAGFEDLRAAHMPVFMNLPPEGARLTDLARGGEITKQSMGYLVDALERGGYLRRDAHEDGRARSITRTDRGWRVNMIAKRTVASIEKEWSALIGRKEMAELKTALRRIAEHLGVTYEGSVSQVSSERMPKRGRSGRRG